MADRTIRPRDAISLVKRCMSKQRPVFLWGPPGIGKSELIETIGNTWNRPATLEYDEANPNARPVIDMRLLLMEPTDIKGIPYYNPATESMKWAKPCELPGPEEVSLHNAILFLDELNAAPPSVQAAAYQLILNRRVGEYELPEGVSIVAAGNRETDKGVTFRMPSPLANRFVHLELEAHFEDWQKWAVNNAVHPDVVGFLSHHKQHLFNFNPKSPDKAFATPRSWVFVSDLLEDGAEESSNTTLVAGTVGEGLALEFQAHRKVAAKLPKPDDILTGKVDKLNVKEISAMYSLTISMCYTLQEWFKKANDKEETKYTSVDWHKNVDNFFGYMMSHFGTEMIVLGAKTALRDYALPIDHRQLKNFKPFHEKYGSYILDD